MEVKILQQLNGIEEVKGTAVIIDVFRAFTVESYLINNGISNLYAVGDADLAYKYKKEHPEALLIGERHGKIMDGFDYGNSPSAIAQVSFDGKTAVHTTSAGTQGIAGAVNAEEILVCSLVNAMATAEYILKSGANDISLVCMGLEAKEPTEEDTLCARYIKSLLEGGYEKIDWNKEIAILKETSGAKFFDPSLQDIFPTEDFERSVEIDKFDFAIKATKIHDGMFKMSKEDL